MSPLAVAILTLGATLLGLAGLILVLPWRLALRGRLVIHPGSVAGRGSLRLGGKTIGLSLDLHPQRILGLGPYRKPWFKTVLKQGKQPTKQTGASRDSRGGLPWTLSMRMARSILEKVHWERLEVGGDLALPDPLQTGLVYGTLHLVRGLVPAGVVHLTVNPVFDGGTSTDLVSLIRIRFRAAVLAWNATRTYFKFKD